jgi:hypothetical protein
MEWSKKMPMSARSSPLVLFYGVSCLAKALAVARCAGRNLSDINYHGLDSRTKSPNIAAYAISSTSWSLEDELMSPEQKKALFENTARAMGDAPKEIKVRHIGNCLKADPAYGEGVAKALGYRLAFLRSGRRIRPPRPLLFHPHRGGRSFMRSLEAHSRCLLSGQRAAEPGVRPHAVVLEALGILHRKRYAHL